MIEVKIKPISAKERYVYQECCTNDPIECESLKAAYKISIEGWITDEPFYICKQCFEDYMTFGQITLKNHSVEVLRGREMSIYPDVQSITLRFNETDDRLRQKELIPKTVEVREIQVRN